MNADWGRRAAAEFVGTFTLVFVGIGAIAVGAAGGLTGVALAHGLAIAVMASAVGHISGAHFNPAVTLGFVVTRRIDTTLAAIYIASQVVAAIVASLLLAWLLPSGRDAVELGTPALGGGIGALEATVLEAILTFFLVWVIFATAVNAR